MANNPRVFDDLVIRPPMTVIRYTAMLVLPALVALAGFGGMLASGKILPLWYFLLTVGTTAAAMEAFEIWYWWKHGNAWLIDVIQGTVPKFSKI